jgi:hypothetical protein
MALWLQYLLVAAIVLGSIAFLTRQIWATLMGKKSKLGSCCSTGCAAHQPPAKDSATQRVQFLPAEMLGRKK